MYKEVCRQKTTTVGSESYTEPRSISQIDTCVSDLTGAVTTLHELVEELYGRLQPVIKAVPPGDEEKDAGVNKMLLCELGEAIDCQTIRVGGANEKIKILLDRLAV